MKNAFLSVHKNSPLAITELQMQRTGGAWIVHQLRERVTVESRLCLRRELTEANEAMHRKVSTGNSEIYLQVRSFTVSTMARWSKDPASNDTTQKRQHGRAPQCLSHQKKPRVLSVIYPWMLSRQLFTIKNIINIRQQVETSLRHIFLFFYSRVQRTLKLALSLSTDRAYYCPYF